MFAFFDTLKNWLATPEPTRSVPTASVPPKQEPASTVKITDTPQSTLPPPNKPKVQDPVKAEMTSHIYYDTERGPVPWNHSIFCSKVFAETVLTTLDRILIDNDACMVHIGVYNPRMARRKDGTPITPTRWSNHAYGSAIDFKGVIIDDNFISIPVMKKLHAGLFIGIKTKCAAAITAAGYTPEIVDEGDWLHIGIWHS